MYKLEIFDLQTAVSPKGCTVQDRNSNEKQSALVSALLSFLFLMSDAFTA